jgi:hypothetical protein
VRHLFEYFNVAIASPDKAVEATTKYLAKGKVDAEHVAASTARELSSAEVAALRLKAVRSSQHERAQEAPYPFRSVLTFWGLCLP